MNRRLLIGLVLVVPLGLGWWARSAASWRPVAMGDVAVQNDGNEQLKASEHYVLSTRFGDVRTLCTLFDMRSGEVQPIHYGETRITGLEDDRPWSFYWDEVKRIAYVDMEKRKQFSVKMPEFPPNDWQTFRIYPREKQAVLAGVSRISIWDASTARLKTSARCEALRVVLSRDGRTFISSDLDGFQIGDVATGKIQRKVAFQGFHFFESLYLSPYGQYGVCEQPANTRTMKVVQVASGKALWSFLAPSGGDADWTIPDNEQTIFVRSGKEWEVRNLRTGVLQRHLPVVPDTSVVAASPDGATLYSVANGVLYRQRAR